MKKLLITTEKLFLIIATLCLALPAISANKIFDKYEDMKDAELMILNLSAMKSAYGINMADLFSQMNLKAEDIKDSATIELIADFMEKTDEILLISTKNKASSKIKSDIKTLRKDHELIMSFKEENTTTTILFGNMDSKQECIFYMLSNDAEQTAMTCVIVGDISKQNIGKMMELYQSSRAGSNSTDPSAQPTGMGLFSVSPTKTVQFAPGNLQYQASTNTWRFAETQYDYVGMDNRFISPEYDGWIDLFGYGTGDNPTNVSRDDNDYAGFVEWGNNPVSNGGNEPNSWRTLSYSEWAYIFFSRKRADHLYGFGEINGVGGIVILPDNWEDFKKKPAFVNWIDFKNLSPAERQKNEWANSYNKETWEKMELLGAVFIPCCGYRRGTSVYAGGGAGNYFTSTPNDENTAFGFGFNTSGFSISPHNRNFGHSVRLVRDSQ